MKSMSIVLWYFFIIYATSVIVNFSHYHKTLGDSGESSEFVYEFSDSKPFPF